MSSLVRQTLGELLLSKLSDPRVDPACTSITGVEMSGDMLTARVQVSVMGTEAQQRKAIRALRHASGHIQELLGQRVRLRHTPVLQFVLDTEFKKTMETLRIIGKVSDELRENEQDESEQPDDSSEQNETTEGVNFSTAPGLDSTEEAPGPRQDFRA